MINWSEEQKKVIETRGADILVSAAAGSGKTAVLVERIARLVCDEGVSFDELIVMTFTKAAAQEMRERVEKALHKRLEAEPDNAHIRTQLASISRARISTIDSVCQNLIKQYYQYLDIDPNFRVADAGELKIMQSDIIDELLEECYEAAEPDFMKLADTFSKKADDKNIAELIKSLYGFAESKASPGRFFDALKAEAERESKFEPEGSGWYEYLMRSIRSDMESYLELLDAAKSICEEPDGPEKYIASLEECQEMAGQIAAAESYDELYELVSRVSFGRLPAVRGGDAALKEQVKSLRESFKNYVTKNLKDKFIQLTPKELKQVTAGSAGVNRTVTMLTAEFARRFAKAKREANVIDFADAEHFALELLYEERDGELVPSAIADEIAMKLKEIMIDEYQDSNAVQDALLKALSAERFGRPDVFMVGDVKQSIYRFRKAEPKIFTEKYDSFTDCGEHIKIELNSNFRSRSEVLYSVNAVFDRIMQRELGGVEYDAAARLNAKATFTDNLALGTDNEAYSLCGTELLIADASTKITAGKSIYGDDEARDELAAKELEFNMIARRINELVNKRDPGQSFKVQDKDGSLRPAEYGDIAILLRNVRSNAEQLADILGANGIPSTYDKKGGYFETTEVDICLAMLNIIDNPHQDIPLASVMRSPMYGFTDDELAFIKARYRVYTDELARAEAESDIDMPLGMQQRNDDRAGDETLRVSKVDTDFNLEALSRDDFWNAVRYAAESDPKAAAFTESLSRYRRLSDVMPVHRLLQRIYDETGYYNYVTAMPLGEVRHKNLDKLSQLAENYAGTGMQGLYNFIRYVEELLSNNTDEGSAAADETGSNSVKIVTIHGSKGLEYPIVFLARCSDSFSRKGAGESDILVDNELGIASDYIDAEIGLKYPSLKRAVIKLKSKEEDLGELQRLLYVALTRAKEKLIITGTKSSRKAESVAEIVQSTADRGEMLWQHSGSRGKLNKRVVAELGNYLDMILMAAGNDSRAFDIRIYDRAELVATSKDELMRETDSRIRLEAIRAALEDGSHSEYEERLTALFTAEYAYETETKLRPKVSVSEIKLMEHESSMDMLNRGKALGIEGASRGTAFHRAMELVDFSLEAEENLQYLAKCGKMTEAVLELLDKDAVRDFFKTELAEHMREAARDDRLRREQHFMIGRPARELIASQDSDELQLLQGIIDAYIEEKDGSITLIDYKTDRTASEAELAERYRIQLELYAAALEQLTARPVQQKIIYSTFMKRQIML